MGEKENGKKKSTNIVNATRLNIANIWIATYLRSFEMFYLPVCKKGPSYVLANFVLELTESWRLFGNFEYVEISKKNNQLCLYHVQTWGQSEKIYTWVHVKFSCMANIITFTHSLIPGSKCYGRAR